MNWWQRLRKKDQLDNQLDAELRYHFERQVADNIRGGMSQEEAHRQARHEFGGLDQVKEECREARGTLGVETTLQDIRIALRTLRKSPGFAVAAIATLALGIGANTAIFSVVYAVLLEPLPYKNPEQVIALLTYSPQLRSRFPLSPVRPVDFDEFRRSNTVLSGISALGPAAFNLTGVGEPERLHGAIVSANFFSLLGTPPELGRTFLPEEDVPGHDRVVVISHDLWVRRFGADPRILGRALPLDGQSHLVVGVMPAKFPVPTGMQLMATVPFGPRIDIWKPIAFSQQDLKAECCWDYCMLARLKPGVTRPQAQEQLDAIAASIAGRSRDLHYDLRTELIPIRKILSGETGQALPLVLGAVGLLLAIACLNLANLLLARVSTRRREFATRAALGAPRRRLVRQLLTESLVLASFGASAGLLLAHWGTRLLISLGPADSPALQSGRINGPVLLFTLIAALVTGVAFGLVPAFESARRDLHENLQDGSRGMTSGRRAGRLRRALVTVEVALCTGLLLVASLLLHSFVKVMSVDKGFAVEKILTADLTLSAGQSPAVFYREILDRIRALPGVLSAGAVSALPLQHENGNTAVYFETDTKPSLDRPASLFRYVTPGYFAAMGTPLLAGRSFADQEPAPVVAISAGLADRLWPGQPPSRVVGLRLRVGDVNARPATVVGVIGHVRTAGLEGKPLPTVYLPHAAFPSPAMSLVVRTAQEPRALAGAIRSEVWKLNRNLPIPTMRTMREIVSAAVARRRFQMVLIALFASLSLALAVVGIYGVTSYSVAHRTREIGLRMALGASQAHVLQLVLAQGLRPVLVGLALGLVFAGSAAISLRSLLFGIGPLDPVALGAVSGTLLLAATLACYLPARRASSVDPATVLRLE